MEKENLYYTLKEKYHEYLKLQGFTERTIDGNLWNLKHFLYYMRLIIGVNDPRELKSSYLIEYRHYLSEYVNKKGKKDKASSINKRINAIRNFLKYLYEKDYIAQNLVKYIPYVKEPKLLPGVILNDREVKKIINECRTDTVLGYRDRAILEVFYSSGLRRNELLNLRIDDVDTDMGYIRVNQGKGRKDRIVPLGKVACNYVENYKLGIRRVLLNGRNDPEWLFLSKSGRRIWEDNLRKIILKYAKRARVDKAVSSHVFRRSCATEMIKNNANIVYVKELLGHESITSTQVYTKLTITDLKKAHEKYHPRERLR